jgi:hypothetical protein
MSSVPETEDSSITYDNSWNDIFCTRDEDEEVISDSDDSDDDTASPQWERDSDGEEEEDVGPAIQVQRTQLLRDNMKGKNFVQPIRDVLTAMENAGIDIPIFLDCLCWGDMDCTKDAKIRYACSSLMKSKELPNLLRRWHRPLRLPGSKKKRPKAAADVLEAFASECCQKKLEVEMESIAETLSSRAGEDIKEETLVNVRFAEIISKMKIHAPTLWGLLRSLAYTLRQERRNTEKDPDKVCAVLYDRAVN